MRILVLNGPNLNLLGEREPEVYGRTTLSSVEENCRRAGAALGAQVDCFQSNHEGALIDRIHDARADTEAIVINPAGLSFGSVALLDALKTFAGPVIELHISNIHARDEAHRHSIISQAATGVICGLGVYGYVVAIQAAARMLDELPVSLPEPIRTGPL